MTFLTNLKKDTTEKLTENGAKTYSSSLDANVDLFATGGALRSRTQEVSLLFGKAYSENKNLALRNLTFLRDIRHGGLGEREVFRKALKTLIDIDTPVAVKYTAFISDFGRWDDVIDALAYARSSKNVRAFEGIADVIRTQWELDGQALKRKEPTSLLGKWLPNVNTTNNERRAVAHLIREEVLDGWGVSRYRRRVVALRKHIGIVEHKLTEKRYEDIIFEKLPSRALFHYRNTFWRHMPEAYADFLDRVAEGKSTLKAGNVLPYEIVHNYMSTVLDATWGDNKVVIDPSLEATWKALPSVLSEEATNNAIVVADVSGSMLGTPMEVSLSLGLYSAERLGGAFKDHFITFSSRPTLIHVPSELSLGERLVTAVKADWGMSTDIEAVFKLILDTALTHQTPQEELPETIIVVTDMEWDESGERDEPCNDSTFRVLKTMYAQHGYTLPNVVFWNVDSRNKTIPVRYNEQGVALVSGLTPNLFKQIAEHGVGTPHEFMMDVLSQEYFSFVDSCFE